jgi:folate-dependent phosphoribosylglycinamide formyltransferase PurN
MYRLGILTSLYDDYAVELLRAIDSEIGSGTIAAKVAFLLCNVKEGASEQIDRRIRAVKDLKNMADPIFFPSVEFEPELRREDKQGWRLAHDRALMRLLPEGVDSCLTIGYMQIIGPQMLQALDVVNIHPAIPEIGPIGMWPKVMEEQILRPLPYLLKLKDHELAEEIPKAMSISRHKAGGMLHIATEETDRGPVIAWYEFALTSEKLDGLWIELIRALREKPLEEVKRSSVWEELKSEIRREQFKGEEPLILLAYRNLTGGLWEIRDKTLYIEGDEHPEGYCLNREIRSYLNERGIETLI